MTLPGGSGIQENMSYDGDSRLITQTVSGPATATAPLSSSYSYGYTPASWTTALTSTLNGVTTTQTMTHWAGSSACKERAPPSP